VIKNLFAAIVPSQGNLLASSNFERSELARETINFFVQYVPTGKLRKISTKAGIAPERRKTLKGI
jgi:hypothetical protein